MTVGRKAGTANKATATVKAAAQKYTEDAINALADIVRDTTAPPQARIAAANALLDRGHGKPQQAMDIDHSGDINHITITRRIVDYDGTLLDESTD